MDKQDKVFITVNTKVKAPIKNVWKSWTEPKDVMQWNNASPDWHTPKAINDLKVGGKFVYRMEAKDGSFGFDFNGVYDEVKLQEKIVYTIEGGRKVEVTFKAEGFVTEVTETFEAETENSVELQRSGWQTILDNFARYTEENVFS